MAKIYFFLKRRWTICILLFIIFSIFVYNLVEKKELFYKAEASVIFIGQDGSFTPELEARRIKEDDFLKRVSETVGGFDTAALKENLKFSFKNGNTLSLSYISTNPALAKDIVNGALFLFVEERDRTIEVLKKEEGARLIDLSKKIEELGNSLSASQKRLRDLKLKNIDSDRRRIGLQQGLNELRAQEQDLLKIFTDKHPDVINISSAIETLQSQLKETPDNSAAYNRIESEVEEVTTALKLKEKEYQQLYDSYKEKGEPWLAQLKEDALLPFRPIGRQKGWYYGWGILTAFLVSIFCGAVLEITDKRIYTKTEAEEKLRLPVIAEIGKVIFVKRRKGKSPRLRNGLLFDYATGSLIIKRFEQLYTFLKVETFKGNVEKKAILIGSAEAGSGKTFIASNLALAAAKNGEKVLLIDANLRHPGVDAIFNFEDGEEGLSDILRGSTTPKAVIRNLTDLLLTGRIKLKEEETRGFDNLKILLSGSKVGNPLGLLNPKELSDLFKKLREAYGMLVIDSSAIRSYPDTLNIIRTVDSLLLVARKARSSYPLLHSVVSQVNKINGPLTGLIFSRV